VRGVVLDLARLVDPALADWIAAEGRFPATMVDRIVPATSEADIDRLARLTGVTTPRRSCTSRSASGSSRTTSSTAPAPTSPPWASSS
jgi:hypothetical protein